jgi:HCOMODA/2-hydroxy-3-carboxy-muconic semialdehyde decarboxylase
VDQNEKRAPYLERFIHGGIFEARPDVMAVVHAHAEDILPFGLTDGTPLKPVIHSGSFIGSNVPVWDIADKFGDTNLLVANVEQGQDLAKSLGSPMSLMRGHGWLPRAPADRGRACRCICRNARALWRARQLGGDRASSQGDRRAQSGLQTLFRRDLARVALGDQGGRRQLVTRPTPPKPAAKKPAKKATKRRK